MDQCCPLASERDLGQLNTDLITVLLADDVPQMRQAVRLCLEHEPDLKVVGEAENGLVAIKLAFSTRPDVVLMDVDMPVIDGLAAADALATICPHSAVIVLSINDDSINRERASRAGAVAFLGKHESVEVLLNTIRGARPARAAAGPEPGSRVL